MRISHRQTTAPTLEKIISILDGNKTYQMSTGFHRTENIHSCRNYCRNCKVKGRADGEDRSVLQ